MMSSTTLNACCCISLLVCLNVVLTEQWTADNQEESVDDITGDEPLGVDNEMTKLREQIEKSPRLSIGLSAATDNTFLPLDCYDILNSGHKASGVYTIYYGVMQRPLEVYCDMTTDGGGWTVFQRRQDGSLGFYRNWANYTNGFGLVYHEFWLGNEKLYWLLNSGKTYHLRIDLADFSGNTRYAEYDNFKICTECCQFKLTSIGSYRGNAGDSLSYHVGNNFSTFDQDNDARSGENCATKFKGAWWYNNCHNSNLNGLYLHGTHSSYADGVEWSYWTGQYYSLRFTEMKIRPRRS